jgi:hypothetical protein
MMRLIGRVVVLALLSSVCAAGPIYRSEGKDGPVFTDQPTPNAKPVELPPVNITPGSGSAPVAEEPQAVFAGYRSAKLVVPSSIPNGLAPTLVQVVLDPELQDGHHWQLTLDGAAVTDSMDNSYTFEQLARGPHHLGLTVVDAAGAVLISTGVDIFVYRPNKNR